MSNETHRAFSDLPIPPGEILAEELEARSMTQGELADRLGTSQRVIDEIIRGDQAITPNIAIALFRVLGIEASYWTNLEADYRSSCQELLNRLQG